jgi:hypothetical protein
MCTWSLGCTASCYLVEHQVGMHGRWACMHACMTSTACTGRCGHHVVGSCFCCGPPRGGCAVHSAARASALCWERKHSCCLGRYLQIWLSRVDTGTSGKLPDIVAPGHPGATSGSPAEHCAQHQHVCLPAVITAVITGQPHLPGECYSCPHLGCLKGSTTQLTNPCWSAT